MTEIFDGLIYPFIQANIVGILDTIRAIAFLSMILTMLICVVLACPLVVAIFDDIARNGLNLGNAARIKWQKLSKLIVIETVIIVAISGAIYCLVQNEEALNQALISQQQAPSSHQIVENAE